MNRRQLLKLLAAGGVGSISSHVLDIDRLLWVPGAKTIFIPAPPPVVVATGHITVAMIEQAYQNIMLPRIRELFERDDVFYKLIQGQCDISGKIR